MRNPRNLLRARVHPLLFLILTLASVELFAKANDQPVPPSTLAIALAEADAEAIQIDGLLSEAAWERVQPATNFRQREPFEGVPASETTEVRVLFGSGMLYIGIKAFDRNADRMISRILERDKIMTADSDGKPAFAGDDAIALLLDPFHDHRNAFIFASNPNGAQFDATITDEGQEFNADWRAVWHVATQRLPDGWSVEFAIPFRTLRYPANTQNLPWGFNVYRVIRHKNEEVLWSAWSRDNEGFARVSQAGHLYGMGDLPRSSVNLEVKPFALSRVSKDHQDFSQFEMNGRVDAGLDAKWEVRPGLLLDLTLNTDFAQVEADDEQVNLTRFDLFFPEKRDFFLENAGLFDFGDRGVAEPPPFLLFFSRRIGISDNGEVPVLGGARLTGRAGRQTVGFLNVVTDREQDESRTNFAVARVKRDVGNGGFVGVMAADRRAEDRHNTAGGIDWSLWPTKTMNLQGFLAQTVTSGPGGDGRAYRLGVGYNTDRVGFSGHHIMVGAEAKADMGFITRKDMRRTKGLLRLTGRPSAFGLRLVNVSVVGSYVTRVNFNVQDWETGVAVNPQWDSGESLNFFYLKGFTRLSEPFDLAKDVTVEPGDYDTWQFGLYFDTSQNRSLVYGSQNLVQRFFDGNLTSLTNQLKLSLGSKLALTVGYTHNRVDIPTGSFDANLATVRVSYAFSTRLVTHALFQYNSVEKRLSKNFRMNFLHRPGSDLFFVYNEQHGSDVSIWDLESRTAILKMTYLQRF
jgi:hypothetical protein